MPFRTQLTCATLALSALLPMGAHAQANTPLLDRPQFEEAMGFLGWIPLMGLVAQECIPDRSGPYLAQLKAKEDHLRRSAQALGVADFDAKLAEARQLAQKDWKNTPREVHAKQCADMRAAVPAGQ